MKILALTALRTEALACFWAVRYLRTVSCYSAQIRTDYLLMIHCLADPESCPQQIRSIIDDILYICSVFSAIQVDKVRRSSVAKAHNLAYVSTISQVK